MQLILIRQELFGHIVIMFFFWWAFVFLNDFCLKQKVRFAKIK